MDRKIFNELYTNAKAHYAEMPRWIRKEIDKSTIGERGEVHMTALLVVAVLASVTFIVIANLWPSMQTAYIGISTTSGDVASNTSHTMFGLLLWIIPLGLGIALLIKVLKSHE